MQRVRMDGSGAPTRTLASDAHRVPFDSKAGYQIFPSSSMKKRNKVRGAHGTRILWKCTNLNSRSCVVVSCVLLLPPPLPPPRRGFFFNIGGILAKIDTSPLRSVLHCSAIPRSRLSGDVPSTSFARSVQRTLRWKILQGSFLYKISEGKLGIKKKREDKHFKNY